MILKSEERIKEINTKLAWLAQYVKFNNQQGMTDINKAVEDFFCGLLNIIFNASLENMNYIQRDYPAVDLGDEDTRLAVQVTSTSSREKIIHTLDKFFEHRLDQHYSRLVVLIVGKKEVYKKKFLTKRNFRFDKDSDIWDIDRLGTEISELEDDAQEAVNRYLDQQMKLPWEAYQKAAQEAESHPIPETSPAAGEKKLDFFLPNSFGFIGRDAELARLEAMLRQNNDKLFFITGLGGMGKTELAVRFGLNQSRDFKVHFVRFSGSFRQTVSLAIAQRIENLRLTEYDNKPRPEPEIYREAMAVLRSCGRDVILIIDNADPADGNFDSLADETYQELCGMDLRLVITTRAPVPGGVKVERMGREKLHELIGKYAKCSEADADALIEAVDGHTLTIDLMARTMKGGWKKVTPQDLLKALKTSTLSSSIQKKVTSDYKRDNTQEQKQKQIHEHLRAVFNVAGVPENARQALGCAVLLPEGGMDADLFCDCLPPAAQEALDVLADRAWLRSDNDLAAIHPVIRLVCHEELKPTDESCGAFLNNLWGQYDNKKYDTVLYTQMAELFSAATEKLEDTRGDWADHGRKLWHELGQSQTALTLCEKVQAIREKLLLPDDPKLAAVYNDLGHIHRDLGHYALSFALLKKALDIRKTVLSEDDPDLAMSYNNVGVAYSHLGNYQKALEYDMIALTLRQNALPSDHPDLALSYDNIGGTYGELGEHSKALEYDEKALEIRKRVLPPGHPDLATSYNNIGLAYSNLGDHPKALEYDEKALKIRKRVLPPGHPDLATSYNNVGCTYDNLGDHQKALEYKEKALETLKKVLPPDHPDLAYSYDNVGYTYGKLGDYPKALEHKEKALEIRKKVLPPDHPDLATSYNNVGCTYDNLGDHQKALEYKEKALEIRKKVLPPNHPDLAYSYDNVGYTYSELGDHRKALEYSEMALKILKKVLPPDHPDLATSYNSVGFTYGVLKQYDLALEYLEKSLQILEAKLPPEHPHIKLVKDSIAYYKNKRDRVHPGWMSQIN